MESFAPGCVINSNAAIHQKRETCRICSQNRLTLFLSLGPQPLANSFLRSSQDFSRENFYPLDVYLCETCSLVQLLDVIDPEILFRDYIYVSGTSDTMAAHYQQYAQTVMELLSPAPDDLVIEVASNDGSLLKCFKGVRTLGIEPARNIAALASASGVETVNEFLNSSTAREVQSTYGPAKAVIANNVLAHVDDTLDFLAACKKLLSKEGMLIVEVPSLRDLIEQGEYDTVYHEHLCYFSVTTLMRACELVGLFVTRVDPLTVHGGSLRLYASAQAQRHSNTVVDLSTQEKKAGLQELRTYEQFATRTRQNRDQLHGLLTTLKSQGKSIAGYGAPAKGNTLLNYCRISTDLVSFTVDKNPRKVGTFTPGMHIPVKPVESLLDRQPDYALLLSWNFADEIMQQQEAYRERAGKFIVPLPEPGVV